MNRLAVAVLTGFAATACGPADAPRPPGHSAAGPSILAHAAALDHLPATTLAVVAIREADVLPAAFGDELRNCLLPVPERRPVGSRPGAPRGSSASWLGIDSSRPMGVALLDTTAQTTVCFAEIAEPAPLIAALDAGPGIVSAGVGNARVYSVPARTGHEAADTTGWVVRGEHVFAIRSQAVSRREWAAVELAGGDPGRGLARAPGFGELVGRLAVGRDVAAYLAADAVGRVLAELSADQPDASRRALTLQVARDVVAGWGQVAIGLDQDGATVDLGLSIRPVPGSAVAGLFAAPSPEGVGGIVALLGELGALRWQHAGPRYALVIGQTQLAVAVVGRTLMVGTDYNAVERALAGEQPDPTPSPAGDARVVARADVDAGLWIELFAGGPRREYAPRQVPEFGNDDVPYSEQYQQAAARFTAAGEQLAARVSELEALERQRRQALASAFGALSLTLTIRGDYLLGSGRQRLGEPNLPAAVARAKDHAEAFATRREQLEHEIEPVIDQLDALERELIRVRVRDVEGWDRRPAK